ncbi:MAG: RNA polymerase factor sigma-54 [Betaproteobacteria bacterium]
MKPGLSLKLSQHLTLTPQLQQSIRLLQMSTVELEQEVDRYLQENPFLERAEGDEAPSPPDAIVVPVAAAASATSAQADEKTPPEGGNDAREERADDDDYLRDSWTDIDGGSRNGGTDDDPLSFQQAATATLREHLLGQLGVTTLSVRDRTLVATLIDALDEDGYLSTPLEEIATIAPAEMEVEPEEWRAALSLLQHFDPVGVGARSPSECLCLQLRALPEKTPARELSLRLVEHHLQLLAARDYVRLKRLLRCDDDALRAAQTLIRSLDPRPGACHSAADAHYVIPDVIVAKTRGVWTARLNEGAIPKLRLHQLYASLMRRARDAQSAPMAGQLQEAKWLIKNVQQRFETILRVAQAIVERQRHFFDHGEVAMRPLVLREIADILGLHESTISRVTTQKYMLTPKGTFELKYFFGSFVSTESGGAASATAIRALIRQLIAAETPKTPLTDSKLAEMLGEQGIIVARRTVAKYRESLQIPPVNLRKSI